MKVGSLTAQPAGELEQTALGDQPLLVDAKAGHVRLALDPTQGREVDFAPHVHVQRALEPRRAVGKVVEPAHPGLKGSQAGYGARRDAQCTAQGDKDLALAGAVAYALLDAAQCVVRVGRTELRIADVALDPRLDGEHLPVRVGLVADDARGQDADGGVVRLDASLGLGIGLVERTCCVVGHRLRPTDRIHRAIERYAEADPEAAVGLPAQLSNVGPVRGAVSPTDVEQFIAIGVYVEELQGVRAPSIGVGQGQPQLVDQRLLAQHGRVLDLVYHLVLPRVDRRR